MKRSAIKKGALALAVAAVAAAGFGVSCKSLRGDSPKAGDAGGYQSYKSGEFADADFSGWMSKAEAQIHHEKPKNGDYFAVIEGRDNGGLNEYRYVQKPFPTDKYSQWAVFWGLSPDEFYRVDLKMLRSGFTRDHTQVFHDATGKSYHQAVWLMKAGGGNVPTAAGK